MTNQTAIKPVPLTPATITPEEFAQKDYLDMPAGLKAEMARLSIKSAKTRKGHEGEELASYKLYLDGKHIANIEDMDWGGGTDTTYVGDGEEKAKAFIEKSDWINVVNQYVFEGREICETFTSALEMMAEVPYRAWWYKKAQDKVMKKTKKALVFGRISAYREISWKGVKDLSDMLKYSNGEKMMREAIARLLADWQEGEILCNMPSQLRELGLGDLVGSHPAIPAE